MDSQFLQDKFENLLKKKKFDFVFHNKFLFKKESDIIAFKDCYLYEYEFKVGKADFRKDFNKNRHLDGGMPNYFYYVVSDISVINGDYLQYAGIYVHNFQKDGYSSFKLIKEPELIRNETVSKYELYTILKKIYNGKKIY